MFSLLYHYFIKLTINHQSFLTKKFLSFYGNFFSQKGQAFGKIHSLELFIDNLIEKNKKFLRENDGFFFA